MRRMPPAFRQLWQRLDELPTENIEDSIALRVMVQALVLVGIVAIDVAAETQNNLWAIPLSIIGATWSWYRRRDRNVLVKFCIALGMLAALGAFLVQLMGELNDTRLVLAQLLIQLQVLHSFDLPRRKDLGYSIVIGLILLGVGGSVSQTLIFAPVLLLFVAIALPVLILDYRSRLGLVLNTGGSRRLIPRLGADLSPKRLGLFLLVILGLGLAIFACLPRFPSYQVRTFPVSSPVQFEGRFDSRRIVNPGYVKNPKGEGGKGSGTGSGQSRGPGKLDDTSYYGFNNQINQNLRGQLKPKIVMRVRSQAEGFWRVLAFDRYTGQGWEISRNNQALTIDRSTWSYQFSIPRLSFLGRGKDVVQSYTAVADLPNLMPALAYPKELYFPTRQVAIDPEGSLRSPMGLVEGLTYTVISEVPYRNRSVLRLASTNYPSRIRNYYLQLPDTIAGKVRQRTQEILAKSPTPITAPSEQALYLAQYLKQHYTIQPELPFLSDDEDLAEAFLFKFEGGYPDHFSTTLTVMLRSIGIPARLVAGFSAGEFNPFTGLYVVRNTDAYAMTEVYFPNYGWFAFDPIPGHELVPPSIEEGQTFNVLRQFWKWVAGWLPSPVVGLLDNVFSVITTWLGRAIAWVLSLFSQGWVGLGMGLILATGVGLLGWLGWNSWRDWRYRRWLKKLHPMESLYQQMLIWLGSQGFRKRPAQTPLEYAQQSQNYHSPERSQVIDDISQAYVRWRYGGEAPNLNQLRRQLQNLKKVQLKKQSKS